MGFLLPAILSRQHFSDAQRPVFNGFTAVFSVCWTYQQINKVLEARLYWPIINVPSVWLNQDRDLDIYAALIALYSVLSVWGAYWRWRHTYRLQAASRLIPVTAEILALTDYFPSRR